MYILEAKDLTRRWEYVPEPVDKVLIINEKYRYIEINPRGEYVVGSAPHLFTVEEIENFSSELLGMFKLLPARRKYRVEVKADVIRAHGGHGEVYIPFPIDAVQFFDEKMKHMEYAGTGNFLIGFEPHIFSEGEVVNFPASLHEVCDIISVSARPQVEII